MLRNNILCITLRYHTSTSVCFNGISDHSAQFLKINCNLDLNMNKFMYKRVYSSDNYATLFFHLRNETWFDVCQTKDTNEGFKIFINQLKYYIDVAFPVKKIHSRNTIKPWLTRGFKTSASKLKDLYAIMIETGHIMDKNYYTNYKKVISAAKNFTTIDCMKTWTIINKPVNENQSNGENFIIN